MMHLDIAKWLPRRGRPAASEPLDGPYPSPTGEGALWAVSDALWPGIQAAQLEGRLESFMQEAQARIVRMPAPWDMPNGYVMRGSDAVIPLEGVLSPQGFLGYGSTLRFREALDHAVRNPRVKSVEVRINSPGGLLENTREAALDLRTAGTLKLA